MNRFRPLVGAIIIVFNFYHPAQAQQELTVLRASSINQGTHQTFSAPYQRIIKYAREAVTAAGFDIESSERVDDNVYMILGRKTVAGDPYGEVIRVLAIRKDATTSEMRLLVRQQVAASTTREHDCCEEVYTDILGRVSLVST